MGDSIKAYPLRYIILAQPHYAYHLPKKRTLGSWLAVVLLPSYNDTNIVLIIDSASILAPKLSNKVISTNFLEECSSPNIAIYPLVFYQRAFDACLCFIEITRSFNMSES